MAASSYTATIADNKPDADSSQFEKSYHFGQSAFDHKPSFIILGQQMIQQRESVHSDSHERTFVRSEPAPIRLAMILANSIDCDAMSALFAQHRRIEIIGASADIAGSLAQCRRLFPQVLLIDPKMAFDLTQHAADEVSQGHVRHMIVLDDRLHEGRLAALLAMPAVSYLTRQAGFAALVAAIIQGATCGERSFDHSFAKRVRRTSRGWRLEKAHDRPSVASLTARELEVMALLARGSSVRDCAKKLRLAESTIDNHKARLMKKLQIHKAAELTHLAIRDGLMVV